MVSEYVDVPDLGHGVFRRLGFVSVLLDVHGDVLLESIGRHVHLYVLELEVQQDVVPCGVFGGAVVDDSVRLDLVRCQVVGQHDGAGRPSHLPHRLVPRMPSNDGPVGVHDDGDLLVKVLQALADDGDGLVVLAGVLLVEVDRVHRYVVGGELRRWDEEAPVELLCLGHLRHLGAVTLRTSGSLSSTIFVLHWEHLMTLPSLLMQVLPHLGQMYGISLPPSRRPTGPSGPFHLPPGPWGCVPRASPCCRRSCGAGRPSSP